MADRNTCGMFSLHHKDGGSLGVVVRACNPSPWEAEVEGL
jgi:hypothetical protein